MSEPSDRQPMTAETLVRSTSGVPGIGDATAPMIPLLEDLQNEWNVLSDLIADLMNSADAEALRTTNMMAHPAIPYLLRRSNHLVDLMRTLEPDDRIHSEARLQRFVERLF